MSSLYVYYKVTSADAQAVWNAAYRLLALVHERTGIAGRLLRRQEQPGTWMEVYDPVEDVTHLQATIDEAVAASGFSQALASGARHSERFVSLEAADLALLAAPDTKTS